jgi:hypothetical protein
MMTDFFGGEMRGYKHRGGGMAEVGVRSFAGAKLQEAVPSTTRTS